MSLDNLFIGLGQGLQAGGNAYFAVQQAMEEQKARRLREGLEDQYRRDNLNLERDRLNAENRAQDYSQRRDQQKDTIQAARDAGIVGFTPGMLDAARDGNQTQSGVGAGVGGNANALQSAIRSLQLAQSQPGYDAHKQVDLGGGLAFQGPEFGKDESDHFTPVYGADNEVGAFSNKNGGVKRTGFIGRQPIGTDPNNPRAYQYVQGPDGKAYTLNKVTNRMEPVSDPATGQQFSGTQATPGQAERDASSAVAELGGAVDDLKQFYKENGYQAPGLISQEAMRHGGAAGNAIVGAMDPKYQSLYNKQQFALNNLLYLKSGKVITDNEFKRLRGFIEVGANDTPQSIQDKLGRLDTEMAALSVKAGRANPGGPVTPAPSGGKKYVLPDGTVVE